MILSIFMFFISGSEAEIRVLGTVQDAGYPQYGCKKICCQNADTSGHRFVTSLLLCQGQKQWLFEASPDLAKQTQVFGVGPLSGVFLTHAHVGHYSGLMFFGRESANTSQLPVFVMPRMASFLKENGPWSQLVSLGNISLKILEANRALLLGERLSVTPILVPHRDEFSETVAFWIQGPSKSALFLPDIDKWEKWPESVVSWVEKVDYAFLDATFFGPDELPGRNMAEIPHPFVVESLNRFEPLPSDQRRKVFFIHFNHTNPLIDPNSSASKQVLDQGFGIAREGMSFRL